jgi:hypothetical protein
MSGLTFSFNIVNGNQCERVGIDFPDLTQKPLLEVITELCSHRILMPTPCTQGQTTLIKHIRLRFVSSLLWVICHQMQPLKRTEFLNTFLFCKIEEPRGLLYFSLLNLAQATMDFINKHEAPELLPYSSAMEWWQLCMCESLMVFFEQSGTQDPDLEQSMKATHTCLKAFQNPASPSARAKYPHLNALVDNAIRIAKHQPTERKQLRQERKKLRDCSWGNFSRAYDGLRMSFAKPYLASPYLKGDGLYIRPSQPKKGVPKELRLSPTSKGFKSGRGRKSESK